VKAKICAIILVILGGCTETTYVPDEAVGTPRLPSYFVVSTSGATKENLDCVLRELTLSNSNNTFERRLAKGSWEINIIYGKNGVVGGGHIGKIKNDSRTMTFYYRPAIGNFGMDTWNVERVVPDAMSACS
jgi:hypothetical protein